MITITFNDSAVETNAATIEQLIQSEIGYSHGVAVACNGEVIPVSQWDVTEVKSGDRIDVLTAFQGG
ncbi:MAG: sulfur carrier protein ThiS [Corynebacterium sp.]|uniref:sulfur carrier protein ThiS n=1 Tax=Corynebacterium sp. TaxID=1720 RepID=UPI0026DB2681|nr:sulfur carrier protein ThiS [Corynebacterium sp.]MDO5097957.1 sulfur carrier protein ThiS [Corynebacterium sp.]